MLDVWDLIFWTQLHLGWIFLKSADLSSFHWACILLRFFILSLVLDAWLFLVVLCGHLHLISDQTHAKFQSMLCFNKRFLRLPQFPDMKLIRLSSPALNFAAWADFLHLWWLISLQLFKLEDVAMGIWIEKFKESGHAVKYINDDSFYNAGCDLDYILAHYQSPMKVLCLCQTLLKEQQSICCE